MNKYPLQNIEKNSAIISLLQKPIFLSDKDESKLLKFIEINQIEDFYNYGSKLIKNSRNVIHLYTYLMNRIENLDTINDEFKNQVAWRLFNNSSAGWLMLEDPEIIQYCEKNTTDKVLLKKIGKIKVIKWYNDYLKFVNIENEISDSPKNIESNVEKYFDFINKLFENKEIKQEKFDKIIQILQKEITIKKGDNNIGALISEKLQEKIGMKKIMPKLSIK